MSDAYDKEQARIELKLAIQNIANRDHEQFAQLCALMARDAKVRFDAYVKAGFTEQQAIQLCK